MDKKYPSYILTHLISRSKKGRNSDSIFFINKWEYKYLLELLKLMNQRINDLERLTSVNSFKKEKYRKLLHLIRRANSYA
jgi:hypothetical protein